MKQFWDTATTDELTTDRQTGVKLKHLSLCRGGAKKTHTLHGGDKRFPPEEVDSIYCDRCSYWYHLSCSNLSSQEFDLLSSRPTDKWTCDKCTNKFCKKCDRTEAHLINQKLSAVLVKISIISPVLVFQKIQPPPWVAGSVFHVNQLSFLSTILTKTKSLNSVITKQKNFPEKTSPVLAMQTNVLSVTSNSKIQTLVCLAQAVIQKYMGLHGLHRLQGLKGKTMETDK